MIRQKRGPSRKPAPPALPLPVSRVLSNDVGEAQVSRMWQHILSKRVAAPNQAAIAVRWVLAGAVLGLLVAFIAVGLGWRTPHPAPQVTVAPGPLRLANGASVEVVDVPESAPLSSVRLSDESVIGVEAGARLEPLASSGTQFVVRLAHGRARFKVVPGGPRRWLVEAGLAAVEVVGTEFTVERAPDFVRVQVTRGVVLVRGATVPDGIARLGAGDSIEVRERKAQPPLTAPATLEADAATHVVAAKPRPEWRAAAASGNYREAYASLGASGLSDAANRSDAVEELFGLADVARLSGHPAEAVLPLQRLLSLHEGSARAPLAALTLGRIELDLGRPRDAVSSLEQALRLGVPAGLEEDAYVRLIQAQAKGGDQAGAARVAAEYFRRFPQGRRSSEVRRWQGP